MGLSTSPIFCCPTLNHLLKKKDMWLFKKKNKGEENAELKKIIDILQKKDETEIRLTIRAVVMFEELSGKMFTSALKNQEDLLTIMYCAFVCSTGIEVSMETFASMLENEAFSQKISRDLKRLQKFTEQFNKSEQKEDNEQKGKEEPEVSITEMADKMIFYYGLDAGYVLEKMQLWELNHFLKGAEEQYKEKMEEQRLWTFLQVAPQIDLKKCKSPEKFMPFPWDLKDRKERKNKELENEAERAKSTIGMTIQLNNGTRRNDTDA